MNIALSGSLASLIMLLGLFRGGPGPQEFFVSHGLAKERVVGLLELPEILPQDGCGPAHPQGISLYGAASKDRPPIASIEARKPSNQPQDPSCASWDLAVRIPGGAAAGEEFPTDESGYETKAAVVYERLGRWYRIALQRGSAWVERANAEGFLAYPDSLTSDRFLNHMRNDWDGRLWQQAGVPTSAPVPAGWQRHLQGLIPIVVLETRTVRAESWVRVRLETESCGNGLGDVTPTEGWIPAHRTSGATSVWFSSRGC